MNVLWRILGMHALAELGARLPAPLARLVSFTLMIVGNLLPLVGVLAGWMSWVDVFVLYWLESVLLGLFAVVRIASATRGAPTRKERVQATLFFLLHFGLVAAALGLIIGYMVNAASAMAEDAGEMKWLADAPSLAWQSWIFAGVGIFLSHLFTLVVYWFGRGERQLYTPGQCMWAPYPRILILYPFYAMNVWVMVILVLFAPVLLVVVLVACKLTLDVVLFAIDRLLAWRRAKAAREVAPASASVPA